MKPFLFSLFPNIVKGEGRVSKNAMRAFGSGLRLDMGCREYLSNHLKRNGAPFFVLFTQN
jgi:hypothetical protein